MIKKKVKTIEIQNPHDKLFKETFNNLDVAKDFGSNYLPEAMVQYLDVDTLEPQKDSYINKALEETFSDLFLKVNINQRAGYVYILFEHKSYQSEKTGLQLYKYMGEIWDRTSKKKTQRKLPVIIPLVIYHGRSSWRLGRSFGESVEGFDLLPEELKQVVPNFRYMVYDLSTYADQDIKGVAQLHILFSLFREIYTKNPKELKQTIFMAMEALRTLEKEETALAYLETLLRYVFSASDAFTKHDIRDIVKTLEKTYPKGSELMKTIADVLKEEGRELGREEGMVNMLLTILSNKFNLIPDDTLIKIKALDEQSLRRIAVHLDDIQTMDDLNKYL
jgi:predicted transposase/invertase (TIGR01784 family)